MFRSSFRFVIGVAFLSVLFSQATGQDAKAPPKRTEDKYRDYFKKPETAPEYWAAMNYEIDVGKFNLAAEDLKGFLAKKPTDEELLQIEEQDGMSAFLRLLKIPELRADAGPLVDRVTAAVRKHRSDPDRLRKLIQNLSASPEERAYSIEELRRSGAVAGPFLVEALRANAGSREHAAVVSALLELGHDVLPPLLAALDSNDIGLEAELIDAFQKRNDVEAVPYLWYPSTSPKKSELVRKRATEAIAYLLGVGVEKLLPAKVALVEEAERYYRHKVRFVDPQAVTVWRWDGNQVVATTMTVSQAEEYYGLRFARQAIDLDPKYEPAQVLFLSIAMDKRYEWGPVHPSARKSNPGVDDLLKVVNSDLVNAVLERALADRRLPVILWSVRALGDFGDVRALRSVTQRVPALGRALYYPDRRVTLTAADAILRIPSSERTVYGPRIVEILRREIAGDPVAHAIVANDNLNRAHELGHAIEEIGLKTTVLRTGREVLLRLRQAGGMDVLLIDHAIADPPLAHLLPQLRADVNAGLVPILITVLPNERGNVPPDIEQRLARLIAPYANVWIVPATLDSAYLKGTLARRLGDAQGQPLSDDERKLNATLAMIRLRQLASGEDPHYDIRPAAAAILKAMSNEIPDVRNGAIITAEHLPGRKAQEELAIVVLRGNDPAPRTLAAAVLAHHIQHYGVLLAREQVHAIAELFASTTDPAFKSALALTMGSFRPDARVTGERLEQYTPTLPAPREPAKEK